MERARSLIRFLLHINLRVLLEFGIRRSGLKQKRHGIQLDSAVSVTVFILHIEHICDIMYIFFFDTYIAIPPLQRDSTEYTLFCKDETKVSELSRY